MTIARPLPVLKWCEAAAAALSEALGSATTSALPGQPTGSTRVTCGRAVVTAYQTGRISAGGPEAERDAALQVLAAAGLVVGWREGAPPAGLRQGPGRAEHEDAPEPRRVNLRDLAWASAYGRVAADLLREDPEGSATERHRRAQEVADQVAAGMSAGAGSKVDAAPACA